MLVIANSERIITTSGEVHMKIVIFMATLIVWVGTAVAGDTIYPSKSIGFSLGGGNLSVKDQSISGLKYSGSLSHIAFGWRDYSDESGFNLDLVINEGTEIENRNISAEVLLLSLNMDFLKMKKDFSLLTRDAHLYYGPSTGTELYIRVQNIAFEGGSSDEALSVLWTIPIGIKADLFFPLSSSFHLEAGGRLNLVSVGLRYPSNKEDDLDLKLLNPVNGLNGKIEFGAVYRVMDKIRLNFTLSQQLSNTSAWDESVLFAHNNLILGLSYEF